MNNIHYKIIIEILAMDISLTYQESANADAQTQGQFEPQSTAKKERNVLIFGRCLRKSKLPKN